MAAMHLAATFLLFCSWFPLFRAATLPGLPPSLTLSGGRFHMDDSDLTANDKAKLAQLYMSLHKELFRTSVLPLRGTFSHTDDKGRKLQSLPRRSVGKFLKKVAPMVKKKSRCLEWGKGYITGLPGCTSRWSLEFDADFPRVVAKNKTAYAAIDVPLPTSFARLQGYFDVIVCTQVFEHIRHPHVAARNLHKLLADGGLLLWSAPFLEPGHKVPEDHFRYTVQGAETMFEEVGFTTNVTYVGGDPMLATARLVGFTAETMGPSDVNGGLLVEFSKWRRGQRGDGIRFDWYWGVYGVWQRDARPDV